MQGDTGDLFRRALEPFRTDRHAEHNYTVWFSSDQRTFHRLLWGGCTVVRTRDPNRFGEALALHLSGHGPPAEGLLRSDGVVALRDGRAIVLPTSFRQQIPRYERPLRDAGIVLHDAPWVDFDPGTGEVALEPPPLAPSCFDEVVSRLPPARRPDPIPTPGRYPLAGWYFTPAGGDGPMSSADAVAAVLHKLRAPLTDCSQAAAVAAIFEHIPFGGRHFQSPKELIGEMPT